MSCITLPRGEAIGAAMDEAKRLAGGMNYRCVSAGYLQLLYVRGSVEEWVGSTKAIIIGLPDGYAIHYTRDRGIGPQSLRIFVEGEALL